MKTLFNITLLSLIPTIVHASYFEDNSGMFSWIFLGFCSLIIVAQVMPAICMISGMIKGVVTTSNTIQETN